MKMKQKAPGTGGNQSESSASKRPRHSITERHRRLLVALIEKGEITREQADRIAHASNSPHHISELRNHHGLTVRMRMESGRDFDGKAVRYGVYWLDDAGKRAARELLREAESCVT